MTDPRLETETMPPGFSYPEASRLLVLARTFLTVMISVFASPVALLARAVIDRHQRAHFLSYVRSLEQLLRRFILIEAIALAPDLPPPAERLPSRCAGTRRDRAGITLAPNDSTQWRVSFAILPSAPKTLADRRAAYAIARRAGKPAPRLHDVKEMHATASLARRLEAMIRVAADPTPFIRRLARHLRAGPPHRLPRAVLSPWDALNDHLAALKLHYSKLLSRRDTS